MRSPWYRSVAFACLSLLPLAVSAQAPSADPSADSSLEAERQERLEAQTLRLIWWNNDKKVEALSLSETQRAAMDAKLRAYLRARTENAEAQRGAYQAFGDALSAGAESDAREAAEQVVELASAPLRLQSNLMIEVIGLLSEEQRELMASEWPKLMSTPWVRQNFGRGSMGGRVPAKRKPN